MYELTLSILCVVPTYRLSLLHFLIVVKLITSLERAFNCKRIKIVYHNGNDKT